MGGMTTDWEKTGSSNITRHVVKLLGILEKRGYKNQIFYNDLASFDFAPKDQPKKTILQSAQEIVHGPRRQAYGKPSANFSRIVALWQAYLDGRSGGRSAELTNHDHAAMMILLKIARLQHTPDHLDSLIDIAGYAATIEMLNEED